MFAPHTLSNAMANVCMSRPTENCLRPKGLRYNHHVFSLRFESPDLMQGLSSLPRVDLQKLSPNVDVDAAITKAFTNPGLPC